MEKIAGKYEEYLRDESRKIGNAVSISFPVTEDEAVDTLSDLSLNNISVTVQGARTGVAAGAVPLDGHILNLYRMDKVTGMSFEKEQGFFSVKVQPGVILSRLREMLEKKSFDTKNWSDESQKAFELFKTSGEWFFPPDPTEASATVGGMTACNSSGACSFMYGPVRNFVLGLDVVLYDGSRLSLRRGRETASGKSFEVADNSGRVLKGSIPEYFLPEVKNASGYFSADGMDLIELFIGSEGTLGVITGIELRLIPKPSCIYGLMAFFTSEGQALEFVTQVRNEQVPESGGRAFKPAAVEFFNFNTLKLLRKMKNEGQAFSELPHIPEDYHTAIYVEYHGSSEDEVYEMLMHASGLLEECGGSEDATWLAANQKEMDRLHVLRHAVPEAVNLIIDMRRKNNPDVTKLGTDMAVPDDRLADVMEMYNRDLAEAGLDSVIFGHIGNNHVHVNILPGTMEEYETGRRLYRQWAGKVVEMGGTVSAEHGIGKLKTALLKEMYGEEGIRQMQAVKQVFDPKGLLNQGNLFG